MSYTWLIGIFGSIITLSIFISHVIFKSGQLSSRVDELERWRGTIRSDMHEISEILEKVRVDIRHLTTLIEERTERRNLPRE